MIIYFLYICIILLKFKIKKIYERVVSPSEYQAKATFKVKFKTKFKGALVKAWLISEKKLSINKWFFAYSFLRYFGNFFSNQLLIIDIMSIAIYHISVEILLYLSLIITKCLLVKKKSYSYIVFHF